MTGDPYPWTALFVGDIPPFAGIPPFVTNPSPLPVRFATCKYCGTFLSLIDRDHCCPQRFLRAAELLESRGYTVTPPPGEPSQDFMCG